MAHLQYYSALQDFRRARHRADLERIFAFFTGKSAALLAYEDVAHKLRAHPSATRKLTEIPLAAIVGSVNHYNDFTRSFLPKQEWDRDRWATLQTLVTDAEGGLPPIEVYQIGEVYFVADGNHRVSIARQLGATVIEAYVTRVKTKVSITPDIQADDLIIKAEYTEFLERTHLDRWRSIEALEVTVPGRFSLLEEQIDVCRHFMQTEQQRTVATEEIVCYWYDNVYLPVIRIIEDQGILRDFPDRTATDLYLWISEHRSIARQIGMTYNEAYVPEIWKTLPTAPDSQTTQLIVHTERQNFLHHTQLETFRPEANLLQVSTPGKYRIIEEHIRVHRYFMGLEHKREIPYDEAVTHWYDEVYLPLIRLIEDYHLLEDFPGYTATDLYLWISEHRTISRQVNASHANVFLPGSWTEGSHFPSVHLEEVIIKAEYIDFLAHTGFHNLRPKADLTVSTPGKYRVLEEHIEVHRYFMGIEQKREIPYHEAVTHWYDFVYEPILALMVARHLLRDFPDLTATDLYLWILDHQHELEKQLGEPVSTDMATDDLVARFGSRKSAPLLSRVGKKLRNLVIPSDEETAQQRKRELALRRNETLFTNILVPISGHKEDWYLVHQALQIAAREEGDLQGLHVVASEHQLNSEALLKIQSKFDQLCVEADVQGELRIEAGRLARKICDHTRQADVVLLPLFPSWNDAQTSEIKLEFRSICRHSSCPIFALPPELSPLRRALVVYDGSPKANEALFVSAYLAGRWQLDLIIITPAAETSTDSFVKSYLKRRHLNATFVPRTRALSEAIRENIHEHHCDLLITGGQESHPLLEYLFENTVDQVLRTLRVPILICR